MDTGRGYRGIARRRIGVASQRVEARVRARVTALVRAISSVSH